MTLNPSQLSIKLSNIILRSLTLNVIEASGPLAEIKNHELSLKIIATGIDDILRRERDVSTELALSVAELRNTKYDSPERLCEKIANADIAIKKYQQLPQIV